MRTGQHVVIDHHFAGIAKIAVAIEVDLQPATIVGVGTEYRASDTTGRNEQNATANGNEIVVVVGVRGSKSWRTSTAGEVAVATRVHQIISVENPALREAGGLVRGVPKRVGSREIDNLRWKRANRRAYRSDLGRSQQADAESR